MEDPVIIGKPAILVVDDNAKWIEGLEFSFGDRYRLVVTGDLGAADDLAQRHAPEVVLLDWEIGRRDLGRARRGIVTDLGRQLPVILVTGHERPEVSDVAEQIGGCVAVIERLETLQELEREIAKVVSCADKQS